MSCQRCFQILTICTMLVLTGELVFAKGEYISNDSDRNPKAAQEEKARFLADQPTGTSKGLDAVCPDVHPGFYAESLLSGKAKYQ